MKSDVAERPEAVSTNTPDTARTAKQSTQAWTESSSDWAAPPSDKVSGKSNTPIALQAQSIDVRYGKRRVIENLNLTLYRGDTLGLLGLNGAGKSTFLRVLAGALAPHAGSVHVAQKEVYSDLIATRENIGYAPETPAVYPDYRVIEFLQLIARLRRIDKTKRKKAVADVLERCALSAVSKRVIGNLSTGYKQRVNLAQAMIHKPSVLILDEPVNGLDPAQLLETRALIQQQSAEQAIIFSSHLLSEVDATCNRVLLIHAGKHMLQASMMQLKNKQNTTFEVNLPSISNHNLNDLPGIDIASHVSANQWLLTGKDLDSNHLDTILNSRGIEADSINITDNHLHSIFTRLAAQDTQGGNL